MKRKRGFTLIELLVVISVISLLASIVLASLNTARDKGRIGAGRQFEANVYHAAADQAVGAWDFDECSGVAASDFSGNGNHGVVAAGISWPTGTFSGRGCGLTLNGSASQHVNVGNSSIFDITGDITISAWVKKASFPSGTQVIVSKDILGVPTYAFGFWWTGPTKLSLYASAATPVLVSSTAVLSDSNWNHVAVSRSGSSVTFYINGKNSGTETMTGPMTPSTFDVFLGGDPAGAFGINGSIDSVRIYAKSLTANEIGRQYADGLKTHPLVTNI